MTAALAALVKCDAVPGITPLLRTATVTGAGIDTKDYEGEALVVFHCSDVASGTGVLVVTMQESDAEASGYSGSVTLSAALSVSTTGGVFKASFRMSERKRYVRFLGTNTGGAGYTFGVTLIAQKKYQ